MNINTNYYYGRKNKTDLEDLYNFALLSLFLFKKKLGSNNDANRI